MVAVDRNLGGWDARSMPFKSFIEPHAEDIDEKTDILGALVLSRRNNPRFLSTELGSPTHTARKHRSGMPGTAAGFDRRSLSEGSPHSGSSLDRLQQLRTCLQRPDLFAGCLF